MKKIFGFMLIMSVVVLVGCTSEAVSNENLNTSEAESDSGSITENQQDENAENISVSDANSKELMVLDNENMDSSENSVVNEDGHVIGEVEGIWYEYLNMQDYGNKPWKEMVLEDGRYGYVAPLCDDTIEEDIIYIEVFFHPEDMQNESFAEDAYLVCVDEGAINYNMQIKPFSITGHYLYFQVQNYESDYFNYMLIGTSDVPIKMFSPYIYTPEDWQWYMDLYPGDEEWGVPGYELPEGWEEVTVEPLQVIEGSPQ